MKTYFLERFYVTVQNSIISLFLLAFTLNATAATTDISPAPLVTSPTASVLPNVFLMMDDSGSMAWDFMPDNANFNFGTYGAATYQCNGVSYNPSITYIPPVDSTGASYANSSFISAWQDGFNTTGGTVNLGTSFVDAGGDAAQPAFYYAYSGAQTTQQLQNYYNTSSTFYRECSSNVGSAPGNAVFTKVIISSATPTYPKATSRTDCVTATTTCSYAEEGLNFANWYSYYRVRINMMKTATGLAFKSIGNNFRVGMATINNNTGSDYLGLATFDATQKANWYAKLYATRAGSSTPLREALANVGRMYAMKLPGNTLNGVAVVDPIQYSCQQNFAILTTDGFWNGATTYNLNGGTVGNQDGTEVRPMYDGASQTSQTATTTTTVVQQQSVQGTSTNTPWSRTVTTIGAACSSPGATLPTSCLQGSSSAGTRTWCMESNNWNGTQCRGSFGAGGIVYLCRGMGNSTNTPGGDDLPCEIDNNGQTWCVFANNTTPGTTSCTSNGYNLYVCATTGAVSGTSVTTQQQTYTQSVVGTTTTVTNYPSTSTSTVTTTNGVTAAPVVTTATGAAVVVSSSTVASSDTGAPGAGTTWTNSGGATTSCMPIPPAAGASTPVAGTPTVSNTGAATVTVLSTTTTTAPPVTTSSSSGGTSDTLADVAEYYYITDLRDPALGNNLSGAPGAVLGTDVSANNVPTSGLDASNKQHMTTFTLGLGARGRMVFDPNYQTATSGDFFAVKQGSTASSTTGVCSWQANNTTCNWPIPASDAIENVDDLWHAAVDGRGAYFSATNPSNLGQGLSAALAGVSARLGSAAAATTSTAFITQGDNFLFRSSFVSLQWTGELIRQQIDINTGAVLPTVDWSAQAKLDLQTSRNIYFYNSAATTGLSQFLWANLSASQQAYFNTPWISSLTQFCVSGATCLSATSQALATGANLLNFVRGDRSNEGALVDNTKYYRQRQHVLGDIVDSESVYVKAGVAPSYNDPGYSSFINSAPVNSRFAMVYVGGNDGMLHAFRAADDPSTPLVNEGGQEDWAFVPTKVIPNLYKLADKGYGIRHQFYVDGSPVVGDICFRNCTVAGATDWKTILVGGLNDGGMEYYALDITDPTNPKALWEFTNVNLGYTYGNPKIVKLKNGTWVVVVTSGYNNVPPDAPSGDGVGRVFVLNANDGTLITQISTGVGSTITPDGLGRLEVPVATPGIDATAIAAYAGDMQGNLWRFDINGADTQTPARWTDIGAVGFDAQLLATLRNSAGAIQPITSKPLLTLVGTNLVVNVGTGRYLGSSDLVDTTQQSLYGIYDPLTVGTVSNVAIYNNPRSLTGQFVNQTLTSTTCPASTATSICSTGQTAVTSTNNAVNYPSQKGWYFDFPTSGERNNTDPALMQGTIVLTTNVPNSSSCSVGGDSYLYQLNFRNGGPVSTSNTSVVAVKLSNELASRPVVATLPDGTGRAYVQGSGGLTPSVSQVWQNSIVSGVGRRVSWRELVP